MRDLAAGKPAVALRCRRLPCPSWLCTFCPLDSCRPHRTPSAAKWWRCCELAHIAVKSDFHYKCYKFPGDLNVAHLLFDWEPNGNGNKGKPEEWGGLMTPSGWGMLYNIQGCRRGHFKQESKIMFSKDLAMPCLKTCASTKTATPVLSVTILVNLCLYSSWKKRWSMNKNKTKYKANCKQ